MRLLTDKDGGDAVGAEAEQRTLRLLSGRLRISTEDPEVGGEGDAEGGAQLRPTHGPVH